MGADQDRTRIRSMVPGPMESALKFAALLATAPLWYKPLRLILDEIVRVAKMPPHPEALPVRLVGNRARAAGKAFAEISTSTRKTWAQDDGRVSNARWETGRRPVRAGSHYPLDGKGFSNAARRSGYQANRSRFGSGNWEGGFGRR